MMRRTSHVLLVACLTGVLSGCLAETDVPATPSPAVSLAPPSGPPPIGSTIDIARLGYLDNLLARTAAHEWEADEGMERTLRALVGATAVRTVLWSPDLASYDLTGLIDTARAAMSGDPDPLREAQIRPSLRFLVFDREQLRRMRVDPNGPQPTALRFTPPPILGPDETDNGEPPFDPASRSWDTDCELFFRRFPLGPGTTTCLTARTAQADGVSYDLYAPAPSIAPFHWNEQHQAWIDEAVAAAVPLYLRLGDLPPFDVVLAANLDAPGEAATILNENGCVVVAYTDLQLRSEAAFKQVIARQLAHCFVESTFPALTDAPYAARRWVQDGLATYLSSVVSPAGDIELESLETLRHIDAQSGLTEWSSANFLWFQFVNDQLGAETLVDMVASIDGTTTDEQATALSEWPNIDLLFHDFALAYTDGTIRDSGGGEMVTAWDPGEGALLETAGTHEVATVPAFGVRRSMLVIPADRLARLGRLATAEGAVSSARAYSGGEWGPLPGTFPVRCFDDNRLVIVTTNAQTRDYERDVEVASFEYIC